MNENLDLTEILKNCPKGWQFWSPIFGEVKFEHNYRDKGFFNVSLVEDGTERSFVFDATIFLGNIKSREIILYPSREQRDWSKFTAPWYKKEKFDPKTLKPFDKVITRDTKEKEWNIELFSHIRKSCKYKYKCPYEGNCFYVPYNDKTKHLVGTTEEAPEYYRYWED